MASICLEPQVIDHRRDDDVGKTIDPQTRIEEARALAERLVRQACSEAERIRLQARIEAQAIRVKAREEGWQDGWQAGKAEAEAQMLGGVQAIRQLAAQAQIDRRQLVLAAREQIVDLALQAIEKIVRREMLSDRGAVVRVVQEALEHIDAAEPVKIRVNPLDWETVSLYWTQTHAVEGEEREGEIVVDEKISPGGCIVETRTGSVNGEVDVQLAEIARALQG